ncbi:MAG TPA: VOC family protein [Pirellulales bacterium]|jgi:lactoylglutathione lyase|nr:VOC family protein [Pirellulales bacterium]
MRLTAVLTVLLTVTSVAAQTAMPTRPPITGLSHIALYCHDLDQSRAFYKDFLGFDEPYSLKNPDGTLHLTFIKINDRQSIELFPEKEPNTDRLYHIALETDDAEAMRQYLAAQGVKVPDQTPKGRIGNANYFITDPDGRTVEIVQYLPDGMTVQNKGKFLPDTRISKTLAHVAFWRGTWKPPSNFTRELWAAKNFGGERKARTLCRG